MQMRIINSLKQHIFTGIIGIGPGAKSAPADINGIRTGCHRCFHTFKRTGRSQNFHLVFHNIQLHFLKKTTG